MSDAVGANEANIHASCVVLGTAGLLIIGESGAGKSRLAFALVEQAEKSGAFARWVADDRVVLTRNGETITARAADTIAGMAERRFVGIEKTQVQNRALVDGIVALVAPAALDRLPDAATQTPAPDFPARPVLHVPMHDTDHAAGLVRAWLANLHKGRDAQI